MKILKLLSLILLFSTVGLSAQNTLSTLEEAKAVAKKENKKIVLELYTDWCVYCKRFKKKTLADETIKKRLKDFVFVQINAEKSNEDFIKTHDMKSYPQLYLINESGKIEKKETGFLTPKGFLKMLN